MSESSSPTREKKAAHPFFTELDDIKGADEKLQHTLQFLEKTLAGQSAVDFKLFWDVRKKALDLFKENISSPVRGPSWEKFSELSKEARRLKNSMDEQSDFAAEQIDIAITAIEKELEKGFGEAIYAHTFVFPENCKNLRHGADFYQKVQEELNFLNLFASKVTALRKELIHTEMRIRVKNQFFERLSKAGDLVFPRRKELIQNISHAFSEDVSQFVHDHFSKDSKEPIYVLREEIKSLQNLAKELTLNTHAFSDTRLKLSAAWDQLKEKDKERKQELDKKKELFTKNRDELKQSIDGLLKQVSEGESAPSKATEELNQIVAKMRAQELGRDDVRELRDLISTLKEEIQKKQMVLDDAKKQADEERNQKKQAIFNELKGRIEAFLTEANQLSFEEIAEKKDQFSQEVQNIQLSKIEKVELDKILKKVQDLVRAKKEQAMLNLPKDEQAALEQLKNYLLEKKENYLEIKEKIKKTRQLTVSSGLGFQKAMEYQKQLAEEKEALESTGAAVKEIEDKIAELEEKIS